MSTSTSTSKTQSKPAPKPAAKKAATAKPAAAEKPDETPADVPAPEPTTDAQEKPADPANTGETVSTDATPDEGRHEPVAPKEDGPETPNLDPTPGKHEPVAPKPDGIEAGDAEDTPPVASADLVQGAPLEAAFQLPHDNELLDEDSKALTEDLETPASAVPANGLSTETPATADLNPPPAKEEPEDEEEPAAPTAADASIDRARNTEGESIISAADGEDIDADNLFVDSRKGHKVCTRRLSVTSAITAHSRPIRTLFLAQGREVTDAVAAGVLAQLRKQEEGDSKDEGSDES